MKKKNKAKKRSLGFLLKLFICIGVFLYMFYYIILSIIGSYILKNSGKVAKAVITAEESYTKNNFTNKEYQYQYRFCINTKCYEGPSQSFSFKPGDSILIRYWDFYPYVNQPIHVLQDK